MSTTSPEFPEDCDMTASALQQAYKEFHNVRGLKSNKHGTLDKIWGALNHQQLHIQQVVTEFSRKAASRPQMLLSVGDHWAVNLSFLFDDDFIGMAANRLD